jgi:hypothetical protein
MASTSPIGATKSKAPSKPIIPAVIGMFTYGSSSPYALVLCIEHYLDASIRPIPVSTHIAAVLAFLGSLGWFALNFVYLPQIFGMLAGQPIGMYGAIGVMAWIATLIFMSWACWRLIRLPRLRGVDTGNSINGAE